MPEDQKPPQNAREFHERIRRLWNDEAGLVDLFGQELLEIEHEYGSGMPLPLVRDAVEYPRPWSKFIAMRRERGVPLAAVLHAANRVLELRKERERGDVVINSRTSIEMHLDLPIGGVIPSALPPRESSENDVHHAIHEFLRHRDPTDRGKDEPQPVDARANLLKAVDKVVTSDDTVTSILKECGVPRSTFYDSPEGKRAIKRRAEDKLERESRLRRPR